MCTWPLPPTFIGTTGPHRPRHGCTRGATEWIVHAVWMAANLPVRSRTFLPQVPKRLSYVETPEPAMELTYTAAFLAGMISFLSPCVLPLVPGFVGTMTGLSAKQLQEDSTWHWQTILFNALLFVFGFSALFISLGASAGGVGRFLSA